MKKSIKVTIIVSLVFVSYMLGLQRAHADPGDVTIIITIPAADVAEFRLDFLRECPNNQLTPDVSDPNIMVQKYTDKQWFKHKLVAHGNKLRHKGQVKRNNDALIRKNSMQ